MKWRMQTGFEKDLIDVEWTTLITVIACMLWFLYVAVDGKDLLAQVVCLFAGLGLWYIFLEAIADKIEVLNRDA